MIKWLKKKTKEFVIKRFLMSFLLILILIIGLTLVLLGSFTFNLEGPALITVLILGGLLIGFAIIRLTINSIAKNAIEREEAKKLKEKLKESEKARRYFELELKESYQQPLRIRNIQPILDMGILQIDFELTKFFDQKYTELKNGQLKEISPSQDLTGTIFRFIGGLTAKFPARYGIDLKDMKVKEDPENKRFCVAGANLRFKGLTDFPDIEWEGSVMLNLSFIGNWQSGDTYIKKENECKEKFKKWFLQKLKSGPEELNFLKKPLQEHIRRLVQGIFAPRGYSVELVDDEAAENFLPLIDYLRKQEIPALEDENYKE